VLDIYIYIYTRVRSHNLSIQRANQFHQSQVSNKPPLHTTSRHHIELHHFLSQHHNVVHLHPFHLITPRINLCCVTTSVYILRCQFPSINEIHFETRHLQDLHPQMYAFNVLILYLGHTNQCIASDSSTSSSGTQVEMERLAAEKEAKAAARATYFMMR
jgi:hypothetical protein